MRYGALFRRPHDRAGAGGGVSVNRKSALWPRHFDQGREGDRFYVFQENF